MSDHPFISYLCQIAQREQRGALAHLRRGLGKPPGTVAEMHPYVVPWFPPEPNRQQENAFYLVAALFAAHPHHNASAGSMGATMRRVGGARESMESIERRFTVLLNAHHDALPEHLRHAVSQAASKEVPVNYTLLLRHINHWGHPDRWVQRTWARDFWAREQEEQETAAEAVTEGE